MSDLRAMPGCEALSPFREQALLARLQRQSIPATRVRAFWIHRLALTPAYDALAASDQRALRDRVASILTYGPADRQLRAADQAWLAALAASAGAALPSMEDAHALFYVMPRAGTISPWSSKATNVLQLCDCATVARVERIQVVVVHGADIADVVPAAADVFHDRMTEALTATWPTDAALFGQTAPRALRHLALDPADAAAARAVLATANRDWGLALGPAEIAYLADHAADRTTLSDAELLMFSQVNSEHCRHKIFNAEWTLDGVVQALSLFDHIRATYRHRPQGILSAYSDNAAVIEREATPQLLVDTAVPSGTDSSSSSGVYVIKNEPAHAVIKVETHNHPTAISPFAGAATGAGGEIRDEGATGAGSQPRAGLVGYITSDLRIPGQLQPWETAEAVAQPGYPSHIAQPFDIMLEAPLGACQFNNEFGRPGLTGFFRTLTVQDDAAQPQLWRGFHKPIMIAGGVGSIRPPHVHKHAIRPGDLLLVVGGPGMLIGLGGGAASSMTSGTQAAALDFASVQRGNPEMERRAQMVINACTARGDANPIVSIHDVGAGGLSNALPELVHDHGLGATIELAHVHLDDPGMSPMEVWCNESQERYVLALRPASLALFAAIAERERCPFSVVGTATKEEHLRVTDARTETVPIDLPMAFLFGRPPRLHKQGQSVGSAPASSSAADDAEREPLPAALTALADQSHAAGHVDRPLLKVMVERVMQLPAVGSKEFLITIGDRTVGGLVSRDQMVGPWQVPVADVAVARQAFLSDAGEAMACGERPSLALRSPAASVRMALGEALTNLLAAPVASLAEVRLSANWMSACDDGAEGAALYRGVEALSAACQTLDIAVPVGKDSMSMKTRWTPAADGGDGAPREVRSPLSLVVTAFSATPHVRQVLTPQLHRVASQLVLIDLAGGRQRLGGSSLFQTFNAVGRDVPDVAAAELEHLKQLPGFLAALRAEQLVLAYHDRSDGGVFAAVAEMCFAGRVGCEIALARLARDDSLAATARALFNEELGIVLQIPDTALARVRAVAEAHGIPADAVVPVGHVDPDVHVASPQPIVVRARDGRTALLSETRGVLQQLWTTTSYAMVAARDAPAPAAHAFAQILDDAAPGLVLRPTFTVPTPASIPPVLGMSGPRVAVLREQGVNSHAELAFAFHAAGFEVVDLHMSDLIRAPRQLLEAFRGLALPGGFSYGDVLGAGAGWAKSILNRPALLDVVAAFFANPRTFTLGVCNGCQALTQLRAHIPGAEGWPALTTNSSAQFEARTCLVRVRESDADACLFLKGMAGSVLPIAVSHGEGRVDGTEVPAATVLEYVQMDGDRAVVAGPEAYPANPNGSPGGATGFTNADGRFLALMPHPERVVTAASNTWTTTPAELPGVYGPWMQIFINARQWADETV
ncbi:hypothetical protein CXG81DRAFT_25467 [Caulochytrium protostelioides]|uniref:phosphoribosylformylglycinamidine synthase n=1 Tax=Caulochytrium protostelioides TaxID=1555241 RepID=A0A4P9X933_9FUNG|nr:hypothetical protein CXG81DRAFT_25467 [Caulochytrium protostelioides]|eukprot:RKP01834.1 hypothetical protein CXG81DRAFT_25467 [Caulochytrium protostelioides]